MRLTPPPSPFAGTIEAYIERCVAPNLPPAEALATWTDALLDYYAGPDPMCVVRGRAGSRGAPSRRGGDRVVYSDNSPGRWCTLRALDGTVPASAIGARLDAGEVPVLYAASKEESKSWTWGTALSATDKAAFSEPRLKHCHIDGALQDAPPVPRIRALRNLCPMNHFLWPMPRHFDMHRVGWTEHPRPKDLGESPAVIGLVRERLAAQLDGEQRAVLRRFLVAIRAGSAAPKARLVIRIEPRSTAPRPASPPPRPKRRPHRAPPTSPAPPNIGAPRAVASRALWHLALQPAKPLAAAEVLARHPRHAELTARLFQHGVTARRVVAIANTLYNAARPANVAKKGKAPTPDHLWSIVLSRLDVPHSDRPSKWRPLVEALSPVPAAVAATIQSMDILRLGILSAALIRGPYKQMERA